MLDLFNSMFFKLVWHRIFNIELCDPGVCQCPGISCWNAKLWKLLTPCCPSQINARDGTHPTDCMPSKILQILVYQLLALIFQIFTMLWLVSGIKPFKKSTPTAGSLPLLLRQDTAGPDTNCEVAFSYDLGPLQILKASGFSDSNYSYVPRPKATPAASCHCVSHHCGIVHSTGG